MGRHKKSMKYSKTEKKSDVITGSPFSPIGPGPPIAPVRPGCPMAPAGPGGPLSPVEPYGQNVQHVGPCTT